MMLEAGAAALAVVLALLCMVRWRRGGDPELFGERPSLRPRAHRWPSGQGGRVRMRVEDRGPGVRPEHREVIFRRGGRGTVEDGPAGSGLGLYVSRQLMRDQRGDLWLEDRPGGGAVFVAALPAEPDVPHEPTATASDANRGLCVQGGHAAPDEVHQAFEVVDGDQLPTDADWAKGRTRR